MRRKLSLDKLLTAIMLFGSLSLSSQSYFSKTFDAGHNLQENGFFLKKTDLGLSIIGWGFVDTINYSLLITMTFDHNGNRLTTVGEFMDSFAINPWSVEFDPQNPTNTYVGLYGVNLSSAGGRGIVMKIGPTGRYLDHVIVDTFNTTINGLKFDDQGNLWATGSSNFNGGDFECSINKLDTLLNIKSQSRIGSSVSLIPFGLQVFNSNRLYLPLARGILSPLVVDPYLYWIDSSSNIIGFENYGTPEREGTIDDLGIYEDKLFWYGTIDTLNPTVGLTDFVLKTDTSGEVEWRYLFDPSIPRNIWGGYLDVRNGRCLVVGDAGFGNDGFVASIDTNGNFQWERRFRTEPGSDEVIYDVYVDEGDTIWCSGGAPELGVQTPRDKDFWLLKLDSMGCLTPGCTTTSIGQNPNEEYISLYPNPSSGQFTVLLPTPLTEAGKARIYNIDGRLLLEKQFEPGLIDLDIEIDGPAGLYLLEVLEGGIPIGRRKIVIH